MVDKIGQVGATGGAPAQKPKQARAKDAAGAAEDAVHLSPDIIRLRGVDGIRLDKVLEVRKAIQEGTYLTPERLDRALDGAIDDAFRPEDG